LTPSWMALHARSGNSLLAKRLPSNPADRQQFISRALADTGFFARHVLGMDTDRTGSNDKVSEIGKGGIRPYGPHQEMVRFVDDLGIKPRVLWSPRYSYKSSLLKAYITRKVLAHPDISILLIMHDLEDAKNRSAQIRDSLLENEVIQEMFSGQDLKGEVWQRERWTTSLRADKTIQQPTITCASPKKPKTGGRFNLIIFDDLVSETSYLTESGRKEGIRCVEKSLNLRARGTQYLLVGTPYHPEDANHWVVDRGWHKCIHLDVGCDIITKEDGTLGLDGTARWPNLPKPFLEKYLEDGMTYELFMSQFKLKVVSGLTQAYQRQQFQPITMRPSVVADLTGYLLTDIAPSGSRKGDFNVLAYVGINDKEHVILLDLEIGFWKMHEFCTRALAMQERWSVKLTHRAEVWEDSLNFQPYHQYMSIRAKESGQRLNPERVRRNQHEKSKDDRIAGLALRFQALEFSVADSVPRYWNTGTEVRELWDPEGYTDTDTPMGLPSGDLVDWFLRFPHHKKKDVPDTLALVDATDRKTESRICYWVRPSHRREDTSSEKRVPFKKRQTGRQSRGYAQRFYDNCYRG